jgi:hypothetical protein
MNEAEREELKRKLRGKFEAQLDVMADEAEKFRRRPGAVTFRNMEKNVNAVLDGIGDEISAELFAETHGDPDIQAGAAGASKKNTGCTTGERKPQSSSSTGKP